MGNDVHLITTAEAALILGTSVATVNRRAANGALETAMRYPGLRGPRMFERSVVEAAAR